MYKFFRENYLTESDRKNQCTQNVKKFDNSRNFLHAKPFVVLFLCLKCCLQVCIICHSHEGVSYSDSGREDEHQVFIQGNARQRKHSLILLNFYFLSFPFPNFQYNPRKNDGHTARNIAYHGILFSIPWIAILLRIPWNYRSSAILENIDLFIKCKSYATPII